MSMVRATQQDSYILLREYQEIASCVQVPPALIRLILHYLISPKWLSQDFGNRSISPAQVMAFMTGACFGARMTRIQDNPSFPHLFLLQAFEACCLSGIAQKKLAELRIAIGDQRDESRSVALCDQGVLSFNGSARKLKLYDMSENPPEDIDTVPLYKVYHMHCSENRSEVVMVAKKDELSTVCVYLKRKDAEIQLVESEVVHDEEFDSASKAYIVEEGIYLFHFQNKAIIFRVYDKETFKLKQTIPIPNAGNIFYFDDKSGILYYHDLKTQVLMAYHCSERTTDALSNSIRFDNVLGIDVQGEVIATYYCNWSYYAANQYIYPKHWVRLSHLKTFDEAICKIHLFKLDQWENEWRENQYPYYYRVKLLQERLFVFDCNRFLVYALSKK